MAHQLFQLPRPTAISNNLTLVAGAKVGFFLTETSTPTNSYQDADLSTPHTNPVEADAAGRLPAIYLDPAIQYRVTFTDSDDVEIYPAIDPANDLLLTQAIFNAYLALSDPYKRTAAEIAASVTPVNYAYPEGNALRYGMVGDDATNNDTALANLRAVAAQGVACYIPAGIYRYSTSPNWNIPFLHLRGDNGTKLKHTGSGIMFNIDGGAEGGPGLTYGIRLEDLILEGNANSTVGVYSRGAVHSVLRNIRVRDCTDKAYWIRHGVSNVYDNCIISGNGEVLNYWPDFGFYLDNNGTGYYTADCTFINPVAEAFGVGGVFEGTGCHLADASGNTFLGGTFEAVGIGLQISAGCNHNKFDSTWMEVNEANDIIDAGRVNSFTNLYCGSPTSGDSVDVQGNGATFYGGFIRGADLDAASTETFFCGVAFANTVGITGTGSYRTVGCYRVGGTFDLIGTIRDVLGPRGSFTGTLTGCTTSPTGAVRYAINGNVCTLEFASITGTSNTTAATLTGMPTSIRPSFAQRLGGWVFNNGSGIWGEVSIGTDGVITLSNGAGGTTFTGSGTKGIISNTISYRVD